MKIKKGKDITVTNLLAAIFIFEKISDCENFEAWLLKTHEKKIDSDIFAGYKFFIECAYRLIFSELEYDYSLGLKEDEIFERAMFECKLIGTFNSNCEKVALLANFHKRSLAFINANRVDKLSLGLKQFNDSTLYLLKMALNDVYVKGSFSKDEVLNYQAVDTVFLYFHQFNNLVAPYAHGANLLGYRLDRHKREKAFLGYKYSLQFLWTLLLSQRKIPSSIKKLHTADSWLEIKQKKEKHEDLLSILASDRKVDLTNRNDLDSYFWRIQKDVIVPISKELGENVAGFFREHLYIKTKPSKEIIRELLIDIAYTREPDFDEILHWRQVDFLHDDKIPMFLGVTALKTILAGAVELKKFHRYREKIRVIKVIHRNPTIKDKVGNDYSYGVLINSYTQGSVYDKSWLFFFNTCGDYSGFSGAEYNEVENLIALYKQFRWIKLQTLEMSLGELEAQLNKYSKIYSNENEQRKELSTIRGNQRELRGNLFELFCCYYLPLLFNGVKPDWNKGEGDHDQVDITFTYNEYLYLVECKLSPLGRDLTKEVGKLKEKIKCFSSNKYSIKCLFLFWTEPDAGQKELLDKEGIDYFALQKRSRNDLKINNKRVLEIFDTK